MKNLIKKHPIYESYPIIDEEYKQSYKPFDIVTDKNGNTGFIKEVSFNECYVANDRVQYSVAWLVDNLGNPRTAWYDQEELKKHCNLFIKISENMCHPFGNNRNHVKNLFKL